jgi:hypothetical protein
MAEPRSDDLLRSREEAALLLRLDPQNLSPSDRLRCDLIVTLRLSIDSAQADALEGRAADLGRLIVATESLVKLLPTEPPKLASSRPDPKETMLKTYMEMRARGAAAGQGYDGLKLTNEKLTAEIEQLRAEIAQLKGEPVPPEPAPPTPLPDNVAVLSRPAQKSAPVASAAPSPERMSLRNDISPSPSPPAASAAPLPPTAEERQRALAIANSPVPQHVRDTRPQNEPWRPYVEGSAFHDRWSNRNF